MTAFVPASNYVNGGLAIDPLILTQSLDGLEYHKGALHIDGVQAATLALTYGTPTYVYSKSAIVSAYQAYAKGFKDIPHQICYAVKANSNLAVLKLLHTLGAGFDVVSAGELMRVLQVADASKVVYSGVGKTARDIEIALKAGIACFNVEAVGELDVINQVAGSLGKKAPISLRVNPDVDAMTHPYISTGLKDNKFGIDADIAIQSYVYASTLPHLEIVGIDCHIGSQLTKIDPFLDALDKMIELVDELRQKGIRLRHIDIGGGLGVRYIDENPVNTYAYAQALLPKLLALGLMVYLEPGRNIVANAGVLLTTVNTLKQTAHKNFAIMDASMSELVRPVLYESQMAIIATDLDTTNKTALVWDMVGSVCETADCLAKGRYLSLQEGDLLAITGAGAYGFSMASHYNSRPKPCEVMADKGEHRLIRRRETYADLWQGELP